MRRPLLLLCVMLASGCGGPAFTTAAGEDGGGSITDAGTDATLDGGADGARMPREGGDEDSGVAADTGLAETGAADTGGDDGSTPMDGGADGTVAGDAGDDGSTNPASFHCSATPPSTTIFCCDFDEGSSPPWTFTFPLTNNSAATNTADAVDCLSPPNGYEAKVTGSASTTAILDDLVEQIAMLGSAVTRVSYEFWVYVKNTTFPLESSRGSYPIAALRFGANAFTLELSLSAQGLSLDQMVPADGGLRTTSTAAGSIPAATWTHVLLECDRGASGATVSLRVGGTAVINGEETAVTPPFTSLEADLGILEILPPTLGPNDLIFDDVIIHAYD